MDIITICTIRTNGGREHWCNETIKENPPGIPSKWILNSRTRAYLFMKASHVVWFQGGKSPGLQPALVSLNLSGPGYMVSGTQDNPSLEATLSSVCMWKRCHCSPSQNWLCVIVHNPYWMTNLQISLFLWIFLSFDQSGYCGVNFQVFDTNFCFKS